MVKSRSHPLVVWFLIWDVALTVAAWVGAYLIRFDTGIPLVNNHQPDFDLCVANLPLVVIVSLVSYRIVGMYEIHRLRRVREEVLSATKGVALMTLLVMSAGFARQYAYESRLAMVIFVASTLAAIVGFRRASWIVLGRLRAHGYNQSHALIVGAGRLARRTARSLEHANWMGIQTVAFVDDEVPPSPLEKAVLGPLDDLPRLVQELHIEHVFIALPLNRYADARRVFDTLSQSLVDVRIVADVPALTTLSLTTSSLHGMTYIGLRESPYHGLNVVVKRVMDLILSSAAIALLVPVLAAVALAVRLTSRGPVLYRQERCSLNGKTFSMLKFRTMTADAEVATGPVMTTVNDPRRTRLGSFLRATNLDELPQLVNVFRGDMSLVGPRPERPVFVNQFRKTIPNYMARHAVKCGITGWAQVNGWRGNSSLRKRVQYDLYYITHWNPWFDLRILILTCLAMLRRNQRHAY
jgi:Undecaprenyl-phosphate glucose phosphotransferase